MLITEEYRKLNSELHERNVNYGRSGSENIKVVLELSSRYNSKDILDYGCGKSTLNENLPFQIKQYDPAIEKYANQPEPADIVVCTDVMEHIEPECLDAVLTNIKELTKKVAYFMIATKPALKTLADGRNAHLIVQKPEWWTDKLNEYFKIVSIQEAGDDLLFVCEVL